MEPSTIRTLEVGEVEYGDLEEVESKEGISARGGRLSNIFSLAYVEKTNLFNWQQQTGHNLYLRVGAILFTKQLIRSC